MRTKLWEVNDELWAIVKPLIPTQEELRVPDKGKGISVKQELGVEGNITTGHILLESYTFLRTGIIWNAFPLELLEGLGSSELHYRFLL